MAIITRSGKGSALTHSEVDNNFGELRDGINLQVPKTQGKGLKIGPNGSETFGWHDLLGHLQVYGDPGDASRVAYRGGIKALQFDESDSAYVDFHMPHDYAMGTDIHIHCHWSHSSTLVTGGSVTFGFEMIYAKSHNQAAFGTPIVCSVVQNASTTQYQHMLAEVDASTTGGSGATLDNGILEPDGLILCRVYVDSNDITVSGGGIPAPFIHAVDIHYQSTSVPTKNKSPSFWA